MNPMVDGWMGDDWFHNGAFRQQNTSYIYEQEASRDNSVKWWSNYHDEYDLFLQAGSAGEAGPPLWHADRVLEQARGASELRCFRSDQVVDKLLAAQPLKVPVMLVHSLWDAEDSYGAMAVYAAIKPKDSGGDMVKLVLGPWYHGQEIEDASALGNLRFGSDTARYFREQVLRPFLARVSEGRGAAGGCGRRHCLRNRHQ